MKTESLLLIIFELFFNFKVNFIGEISLSEFFLIITSFYYVPRVLKTNKSLFKKLILLYLGLLLIQFFSDTLNNVFFEQTLKGFAVTVISFLHICFLFYYMGKDIKNIRWISLGIVFQFIGQIIINAQEQDFQLDLQSEDLGMLKYYIVPMMAYVTIFLSTFFNNRKFYIIIILIGVLLIIMGARSGGATIAVPGILSLILARRGNLIVKNFSRYVIIAFMLLYGGYCIYVNQVLSGDIESGNNAQMMKVTNPYNPINLLQIGRAEVFVGTIAFFDKPITGWGTWAIDKDYKYRKMVYEMHDEKVKISTNNLIPGHSVLITHALWYGIAALVFSFLIFRLFVIKGFKLIKYSDRDVFVILMCLFHFIWNYVFSPISHFRLTLPFDMALILYLWEYFKFSELKKKYTKRYQYE